MGNDLMADLQSEAADLKSVPTEQGIGRLRQLGEEMVRVDLEIAGLARQLAERQQRLLTISTREMPDLMVELHTDNLGMPDVYDEGADLVLSAYYKAAIPVDWPEDQRAASFAHLADLGGEDLIKNEVSLPFGAGQAPLASAFVRAVQREEFTELLHQEDPDLNDLELPEAVQRRTVQWNTLTAFVKEQIKKGTVLDLPKLGATVGSIVKIVKRKAK